MAWGLVFFLVFGGGGSSDGLPLLLAPPSKK